MSKLLGTSSHRNVPLSLSRCLAPIRYNYIFLITELIIYLHTYAIHYATINEYSILMRFLYISYHRKPEKL